MAISVDYKIALGEKLLEARKYKGISQRKTAQAVKITNASLSDMENGFNFPKEETIIALTSFLSPPDNLRKEIFEIYALAKDVPPPDISAFIKGNQDIQAMLRELMAKDITAGGLQALHNEIQKMEDRTSEPAE
jgi:transcriptional regulator with XRE-family HTH domain